MKKVVTLMSVVALLFSGCDSTVGGFDSASVKNKIDKDLMGSKWIPVSDGYYDTIGFYDGHIDAIKNGKMEHLAYHVTNVFATQEVLPDTLQLRLKSSFYLNEIYLKGDYSTLKNVYRSDVQSTLTGEHVYKRVK